METKEEIEYSSTLVFTVLSTYYLWEKGCVQSAQGQECRYSTLAMNPLTCQLANVHPHDPTGYCWQLLPHSANWEQIALIEHRGADGVAQLRGGQHGREWRLPLLSRHRSG